MDKKLVVLAVVLLVVLCGSCATAAPSLMEQCADKLQKVMACLSFATGKSETPTKQCCDSVESMKESNPACLCFVIQQIHNGTNPELKSMGIQESRLLQLPSSCKLVNASLSNCPKLLNLPSNSPDVAIFSSNSTSAAATSGSTTGTASPSTTMPESNGFKHGIPKLAGSIIVAVAVFLNVFPAGQFTSTS